MIEKKKQLSGQIRLVPTYYKLSTMNRLHTTTTLLLCAHQKTMIHKKKNADFTGKKNPGNQTEYIVKESKEYDPSLISTY